MTDKFRLNKYRLILVISSIFFSSFLLYLLPITMMMMKRDASGSRLERFQYFVLHRLIFCFLLIWDNLGVIWKYSSTSTFNFFHENKNLLVYTCIRLAHNICVFLSLIRSILLKNACSCVSVCVSIHTRTRIYTDMAKLARIVRAEKGKK